MSNHQYWKLHRLNDITEFKKLYDVFGVISNCNHIVGSYDCNHQVQDQYRIKIRSYDINETDQRLKIDADITIYSACNFVPDNILKPGRVLQAHKLTPRRLRVDNSVYLSGRIGTYVNIVVYDLEGDEYKVIYQTRPQIVTGVREDAILEKLKPIAKQVKLVNLPQDIDECLASWPTGTTQSKSPTQPIETTHKVNTSTPNKRQKPVDVLETVTVEREIDAIVAEITRPPQNDENEVSFSDEPQQSTSNTSSKSASEKRSNLISNNDFEDNVVQSSENTQETSLRIQNPSRTLRTPAKQKNNVSTNGNSRTSVQKQQTNSSRPSRTPSKPNENCIQPTTTPSKQSRVNADANLLSRKSVQQQDDRNSSANILNNTDNADENGENCDNEIESIEETPRKVDEVMFMLEGQQVVMFKNINKVGYYTIACQVATAYSNDRYVLLRVWDGSRTRVSIRTDMAHKKENSTFRFGNKQLEEKVDNDDLMYNFYCFDHTCDDALQLRKGDLVIIQNIHLHPRQGNYLFTLHGSPQSKIIKVHPSVSIYKVLKNQIDDAISSLSDPLEESEVIQPAGVPNTSINPPPAEKTTETPIGYNQRLSNIGVDVNASKLLDKTVIPGTPGKRNNQLVNVNNENEEVHVEVPTVDSSTDVQRNDDDIEIIDVTEGNSTRLTKKSSTPRKRLSGENSVLQNFLKNFGDSQFVEPNTSKASHNVNVDNLNIEEVDDEDDDEEHNVDSPRIMPLRNRSILIGDGKKINSPNKGPSVTETPKARKRISSIMQNERSKRRSERLTRSHCFA